MPNLLGLVFSLPFFHCLVVKKYSKRAYSIGDKDNDG